MPLIKSFIIDFLAFLFRVLRITTPVMLLFARAYWLSGLRYACRTPVPASTQFDGPVSLIGSGNLVLGEYCRIGRNVLFETNGDARIVIGNRVRINDGTIISAHTGVVIGDDTMIGEYVSIRDANHGAALGKLIRLQAHESLPIQIGRDVWIGRGVCILKGVEIADGALVGANSVITCNVQENAIFAGVPGKKIKDRV